MSGVPQSLEISTAGREPQGDSFELDDLKPGDLLFWRGTYNIDRDPPYHAHRLIYLGQEKRTELSA
jgi:cell wall-associated NlpC family hydrolase